MKQPKKAKAIEKIKKPEDEPTRTFPPETLIEMWVNLKDYGMRSREERVLALVAEDGNTCRFYVDYEHPARPYPLLDFAKPEVAPNYQDWKEKILREHPDCYDNFAWMVQEILDCMPGYDELTFERAVRHAYESPSADPVAHVFYAIQQGYLLKVAANRFLMETDRVFDQAIDELKKIDSKYEDTIFCQHHYPPIEEVEMDKDIKIGQNLMHSTLLASWERVQTEASLSEITNPACKNIQ